MARRDLHTRRFTLVLTQNESDRLEQKAVELETSMTGVFRLAVGSDVFEDVGVRRGRVEGISPQRRSSTA